MSSARRETRQNLVSFLDDLQRNPAWPAFALRSPYRRFTWTADEIRSTAQGVGEELRVGGVTSGAPVILQGADGPEWVAAYFSILSAGGIVVPIEAAAPAEFTRRVAAKVRAVAAIAAADRLSDYQGLVKTVHALELVGSERRGARAPAAQHRPPHRAAPGEIAEIVFTSGTTAEPKGVELSHANLLANLKVIEDQFRKREWYLRPLLPLRILCLVPLSHLFGQTLGILVPILLRSTGVFSSTLQPSRLAELIRRERPMVVVAVPRILDSLAEAVRREIERNGRGKRFENGVARAQGKPGWRRVLATRDIRRVLGWGTWGLVTGGAALEPRVERFWTRCGYLVIQGYGLTEAAPIITINNPLRGSPGAIGRPVGEQEVRLSEEGEILVRGPNVMLGYHGDPGATAEVLRDGWLHTGDLADQDDEGRFRFRGRKKDLIVTAEGMNVFPSDVEAAIESVALVREAVVFALPGQHGEEVHAAVLSEAGTADPERIRAAANALVRAHQRLKGLILWPDIDFPRTATGKVRRAEVAAVALALRGGARGGSDSESPQAPHCGRAGGAGAGSIARGAGGAGPRGSPAAAALARVRQDLGGPVPPQARLAEDLGLSSLDLVEVISVLEESTGVRIEEGGLAGGLTVNDLDRLVSSEGASSASRIPMPRWARGAPARAARALLRTALVRPLFACFVRLHIEGRERLRGIKGPCLFVSNHTSLLDAPAVVLALPRPLRVRLAPAMAIETLPAHFEPEGKSLGARLRSAALYNLVVLLFNAYPFPQSRGFRPSLEYTGDLLDAGFCPLVFPEGHMTLDGRMRAFKTGIGLLALETRVPIVPIGLRGFDRILHPEAHWPRRGHARVTIGDPIDLSARAADGSTLQPAEASRLIEEAVKGLVGD